MIKGKSVRTTGRIISAAKGATRVRFAVDVTNTGSGVWEKAGFPKELEAGQCIIPSVAGKATEFNAQGIDVPQKKLPKETVTHMIWKTWTDWHGYQHSGFVAQDYKRYPRIHIDAPAELLFVLMVDGLSLVATREIDLAAEGSEPVLHMANVMLELFGEFQIVDPDTGISAGVSLKRLQWKILPKGKYPWKKAEKFVKAFTGKLDESSRRVVERRIEIVTGYGPDFMAIGQGGFQGYFVYGFEKKGVFVLESLHMGNATYVFGDDWKRLSMLTKSDIINGGIEHTRVIHDHRWRRSIDRLLS